MECVSWSTIETSNRDGWSTAITPSSVHYAPYTPNNRYSSIWDSPAQRIECSQRWNSHFKPYPWSSFAFIWKSAGLSPRLRMLQMYVITPNIHPKSHFSPIFSFIGHNVGYKNNDPTHPCQKCWKKYSKAYAGPLLYASWLNPTPDTNFQRPLPSLSAFQPSAMIGYSSVPPRVPLPTRPPMPLGGSSIGFGSSRPPPGSLVVRPGDPRIGGRLCWNCGGDGVVSMFFFDTERCRVCKGMGRVLT